MKKRKKRQQTEAPPLRLDLGAGEHTREGFVGVDIAKCPGISVVHDLKKHPWPWKMNTVDEAHASHFLEHLTGPERIGFMEELWRVLKPGAKAQIIIPYWGSVRSVQDPTHQWPPIVAQSFLYFNADWRKANGIHYITNGKPIDFDFSWAESYTPEWGSRAQDARVFAAAHYTNVIQDLIVTVVKRPQNEKTL